MSVMLLSQTLGGPEMEWEKEWLMEETNWGSAHPHLQKEIPASIAADLENLCALLNMYGAYHSGTDKVKTFGLSPGGC